MPSGCWCPLTRKLWIQKTLFIHPLTHSLRNLCEAPTLSAEREGPLKKGEMSYNVPPLTLAGHETWFDLLGLNFPSPLMRRDDCLPAQWWDNLSNGPFTAPNTPGPSSIHFFTLLPSTMKTKVVLASVMDRPGLTQALEPSVVHIWFPLPPAEISMEPRGEGRLMHITGVKDGVCSLD